MSIQHNNKKEFYKDLKKALHAENLSIPCSLTPEGCAHHFK